MYTILKEKKTTCLQLNEMWVENNEIPKTDKDIVYTAVWHNENFVQSEKRNELDNTVKMDLGACIADGLGDVCALV